MCFESDSQDSSCTAIGASGLAAGNRPLGAQFCSAAVDGFAPCTVAPMTSRSSPSALGDACLKCCHDTRLPSRKRSRWQLISRHHSWPMDCSMIASAVHADSAQLLQLRTAAVDPCISFAQLPARSVKGRHILLVLIVQNGRCLGRCCQRRLQPLPRRHRHVRSRSSTSASTCQARFSTCCSLLPGLLRCATVTYRS